MHKEHWIKAIPSLFLYLAKAVIEIQVTPYNGYIQSDSCKQLLVSRIIQHRFSHCGVLYAIVTYARMTASKIAKTTTRTLVCILRR